MLLQQLCGGLGGGLAIIDMLGNGMSLPEPCTLHKGAMAAANAVCSTVCQKVLAVIDVRQNGSV